jgi:pimeloyl-ACP methyl ester carboxylesterase
VRSIYDRRGSNRSERPEPFDITSVQEHADDALELLRVLGAGAAVVIGRSYGETIALDLALRHPDSVLAVALLEAGTKGLSTEYDEWYESLAGKLEQVVAERGVDAVGEVVIRDIFGAWEELPDVWRDVFTTNSQALLAEVRGGETTDNARLGELKVPALVLTAANSPEPIRAGSDSLGRALPNARTNVVGGDHAIDPAGPDVLAFISAVLEKSVHT